MGRQKFKVAGVLIFFSIIWLIFFARGMINLDPDLGWHLYEGEWIVKNGIPKTDPYSYSMPSFPYVDHEYLTNLIYFLIYSKLGIIGLSILAATITTLTLLIITPFNSTKIFLLFALLETVLLLPFSGIRPQIITWLFLAILMKVLLDKTIWPKGRLFLPSLMLIWANLHGSFILGIIILGFFTFINIFKKAKNKELLIVFLLSSLATLINPYGFRLWGEVGLQLSDISQRETITEWMPPIYDFHIILSFILLLPIVGILIFIYRKNIQFSSIFLFACFLTAALSSQRHLPLWGIVAIQIVGGVLVLFINNILKIKFGQKRFNQVLGVFLVLSFFIFIIQVYISLITPDTNEEKFYPVGAVQYLKRNLPNNNLFAHFNWSGYLIWKIPQKRVFVGGMMPVWRWKAPNQKESDWAFKEYIDLTFNPKSDLKTFLQKYKIKTILWPVSKEESKNYLILMVTKMIEPFIRQNQMIVSSSFNERLEDLGWERVYQDNVAIIYKAP